MALKKFLMFGVVAGLLIACGDDASDNSPVQVTEESSSSVTQSEVEGSSSSVKIEESSSSAKAKVSSSSVKSETSSSSEKDGVSSSSEKVAKPSSSSKVQDSSSSAKVAASSSSTKTKASSSSKKPAEYSSSEKVVESSSSEKPVESSSSEVKSSSSVVSSSSSVESIAEIKPNGYYMSNCPEGKKCDYVSTDYLNQEFLLNNKYGEIRDDRDGKIYKTVEIGEQIWIAQNLNYTTSKSWCYEKESSNCSKYGRLYTWAGAIDSLKVYRQVGMHCGYKQTCSNLSETKWRGVCPLGWHLPTKAEFEKLIIYPRSRSSVLKSNNSWHNEKSEDCFGIDSVGFSALPGGYRFFNTEFSQLGLQAYFWSVTEFDYPYNAKSAYRLFLSAVNEVMGLTSSTSKEEAFSVRCIKD